MKKEPLIVERTYAAPVQQVWDAITNPDKMRQWYFPMEGFKAVKERTSRLIVRMKTTYSAIFARLPKSYPDRRSLTPGVTRTIRVILK